MKMPTWGFLLTLLLMVISSCAGPGTTIEDTVDATVDAASGCKTDADCNDDNVCTKDICKADGTCDHTPLAGGTCDDGNACTAADECSPQGICAGKTQIDCDDANTCTLDECDEVAGCIYTNVDMLQECDGSPCTQGDKCESGECNPGGAMFCPDDDTDDCVYPVCDDVTGECTAHSNQLSGETCIDGNPCTEDDSCDGAGNCKAGDPKECVAQHPCKKAWCNEQAKEGTNPCILEWKNAGVGCDDGDACTDADQCAVVDGGPQLECDGTPISCDDNNSCSTDSCNETTGCAYETKADGSPCALPAKYCGELGNCAEGECVADDVVVCDDDVACTLDSCDAGECQHTPQDAACDDAKYCNGVETCVVDAGCQPGLPPEPDDGVDCTIDSCDEESDLILNEPDDSFCDDLSVCTGTDACIPNVGCAYFDVLDCDDSVLCTVDDCDPEQGCLNVAEDALCDDNDFCNGQESCVAETGCQSASANWFEDEVACTLDKCNNATSEILHTPDDSACDDLDACNGGEVCGAAEGCLAGEALDCDDGIDCTADSCDPIAACTHTPDSGFCDDEVDCTVDSCAPTTGCQNVPDDDLCGDDLVCTTDVCPGDGPCANELEGEWCLIDGNCVADQQPQVDNVCLACLVEVTQEEWTANPVGCDDGDSATADDHCDGGVCSGLDDLDEDGIADVGYDNVCTGGESAECNDNCLEESNPGQEDANDNGIGDACDCEPDCEGKDCGDDGCGGICGECDEGVCVEGNCLSGFCGGLECPVLGGYDVYCNDKDHCEYANQDQAGWKEWDVWVYVPPGSVTMGSPEDEPAHKDAETQPDYEVVFEIGYLIAKYEIVVEQYEACMQNDPDSCSPPSVADWDAGGWGVNNSSGNPALDRRDHPQNGLTWEQAGAYCRWVAPGGRLAGEAEWEFAAKGPAHSKYPWGDAPEPDCANDTAVFDDKDTGWGCGSGGTWPVGSKEAGASWCGAMDMAGNVLEWVLDTWHHDYYDSQSGLGIPADGAPWTYGGTDSKGERGGSFASESEAVRSAQRNASPGDYKYANRGGRCVRPVPATECGGVSCPALDGYLTYCNRQHHCEYVNLDSTGWRKWDIWLYVAPGSFMMGGPDDEDGAVSTEQPVHEVVLADGFFLSKYEAVVEQYEACREAAPGKCEAPFIDSDNNLGWGINSTQNGRVDHPQNALDQAQAAGFCSWVASDGRLPSEAEWEYAASGPLHRKYPWGDSPEPTCAGGQAIFNENGQGGRPWGCEPCTEGGCSGTKPVGSAPAGASWCGAVDMAGNVHEWCADKWNSNYNGAPANGSAWGGSHVSGVLRGGSLSSGWQGVRTAHRGQDPAWRASAGTGARCVRPLQP